MDREVARALKKNPLSFEINKATISDNNIECNVKKADIKKPKLDVFFKSSDEGKSEPVYKVKMKTTSKPEKTDYKTSFETIGDKNYVVIEGMNNYEGKYYHLVA